MDIICIVHASPVKINNNIINIATNCLEKYRLIILMLNSINRKTDPVKYLYYFSCIMKKQWHNMYVLKKNKVF